MTDKKIGDLAAIPGALAGTELLEVQTSAPASKRVTAQQIRDLSPTTPESGMANPMTAAGDLIIGGTSGAPTRLPLGTDGQLLGLVGGAPAYVDAPAGGSGGTVPVLIQLAIGDETTPIPASTSDPVATFRAPFAFTLTDVRVGLSVNDAAPYFHLYADASFVTTVVFGSSERSSGTTPPALSVTDIADDAEFTLNNGGGDTPSGLKVTLIGTRTL